MHESWPKRLVPFEQPPDSEQVYDPNTDPLKSEIDLLVQGARLRAMKRVYNPSARAFEIPSPSSLSFNVHDLQFPNGLGHPQKGRFFVQANFLNQQGDSIGGGWVESFEHRYDAERCAYALRRIDARHQPEVLSSEEAFEKPASQS